MDSNVQVALATKLLAVMPSTEDTLLAFPVAGAGLTRDDLDLFDQPADPAETLRTKGLRRAQFARLMNQIPQDGLRWVSDGAQLGPAYRAVLRDAEVAASTLTEQEEVALARARDYLDDVVSTPDGPTTVYSAALTDYYRYRNLALAAARTYVDEQLTAELSQDPAVKQAWEGGRRDQLAQLRDQADDDWTLLGHRAEVESAQATVRAMADKDPAVRRQALVTDYGHATEPDLLGGDPVGVQATFYSPSDAFEPGTPWTTLTLTADEAGALLAQAPAELVVGMTDAASSIVSLTVEYTVVTVMRPWFDPTFLGMRSWRLAPGVQVCDGATPRGGTIPGWVSALVVARKLSVVRSQPATTPAAQDPGPVLPELTMLTRAFDRLDLQLAVRPTVGPPRRFEVRSQALAESVVAQPMMEPLPEIVGRPGPDILVQPRPDIVMQPNAMLRATMLGTTVALRPNDGGELPDRPDIPVRPRFPGRPTRPEVPDLPGSTPPPPSQPTTEVTEEITLDGVAVLAYRVTRAPRCPDPDPTYDWGQPPALPPAHPFPLPDGHVFGARAAATVHDGRAGAADRVGVLALQAQLKARLSAQGSQLTVDGIFGARTREAVQQVQRRRGLPVTGRVDRSTWSLLWP